MYVPPQPSLKCMRISFCIDKLLSVQRPFRECDTHKTKCSCKLTMVIYTSIESECLYTPVSQVLPKSYPGPRPFCSQSNMQYNNLFFKISNN